MLLEDEFDVAVIGGGVAGVAAAVSAAKCGAKTCLVERYGYLGGQATGGLVMLIVGLTDGQNVIIKGFCKDVIDELFSLNAAKYAGKHVLFDVEAMKFCLDKFLSKTNVMPFYHSFVSDVVVCDNKIQAVILDGKSGKRTLKAKNFIDATGDGDLAKYCEIPFFKEPDEKMLPITLCFRAGGIDVELFRNFISKNYQFYLSTLQNFGITTKIGGLLPTLNESEIWFNISNVACVDATNSNSLTMAEIKAREQIQKIMNKFKTDFLGFEKAYLIDTAGQLGIRESRRIVGVKCFQSSDIEKSHVDKIALAPNYSTQNPKFVEVPYRCLITDKMQNLIFAGRSVSIEHNLIDMFREIPCCMATGQAAGVACAICVDDFSSVQEIDIEKLQNLLVAQGAFLGEQLSLISK